MKRIIALLLLVAMTLGMLAGCGTKAPEETKPVTGESTPVAEDALVKNGVDISETVNLTMYLYGSAGVANQDILDALNEILLKEINATLEIKYIDWGDIATKYPLMWASGEEFDMSYIASNTNTPYALLVNQEALVDITDMLDTVAPTLKAELDQVAWDSMNVNGRIYGVPSTYSEFTAYGFVTRTDLMEKYGIESIASVEDMEKYMDAAVAEGIIPLNGSSAMANDLYRMFIALNNDWIDAPGIPESELYLATSAANPTEIFHPAFTDEFEQFAIMMHEWQAKGYWSKDVLAAAQDDKDNFLNGLSAAFITHQPDWTGAKGSYDEKLPGVGTEFYCFPEANGKIVRKAGVENATGISTTSQNLERSLMMIEMLMTNEDCYRLFQFGILGRQYEIVDGKVVQPESFNAEVDAGGFCGWALRTDKLNLPMASEDERRYSLNEEWKKVAIDNPFVGFAFDASAVSAELSAIANVNAQLGLQILLGKTADPVAAVAQYRQQLEAAGIQTLLDAVNEQYGAFAN